MKHSKRVICNPKLNCSNAHEDNGYSKSKVKVNLWLAKSF